MAVAMATDDKNADSHIGGIGSRSITGSVHNSGGWVCSQLSSDTIRALHGIAGIRDVGMTGKDLVQCCWGIQLHIPRLYHKELHKRIPLLGRRKSPSNYQGLRQIFH